MDWMNGLLAFSRWVLLTSIKASVLVGLIGFIQILTRNKLPAKWHHALWFLLLIRLMLPAGLESKMSIFNWIMPAPSEYSISHEFPGRIAVPSLYSGIIISPASTPGPAPVAAEKRILLSKNEILSSIWLSVALGFMVVTFAGIFRLKKKLKSKQIVNDPELIRLLDECRSRMGVKSTIRMFIIQGLRIPLLYGSIRPSILLPRNISNWRNRGDLTHILCHELAHYKRKDIAVGWLTAALQILHWFNPLIWFAFHRMRMDRELA